jgi:hypothetical protein
MVRVDSANCKIYNDENQDTLCVRTLDYEKRGKSFEKLGIEEKEHACRHTRFEGRVSRFRLNVIFWTAFQALRFVHI